MEQQQQDVVIQVTPPLPPSPSSSSSSLLVTAPRSRLVQHSNYFSALLDGSFSDSTLNHLSIHWDPHIFLLILRSILSFSLHFQPHNFLLLIEGALFFGVDTLLREAQDWFTLVCSQTPLFNRLLSVEYLIDAWIYAKEKCVDFIQKECVACL